MGSKWLASSSSDTRWVNRFRQEPCTLSMDPEPEGISISLGGQGVASYSMGVRRPLLTVVAMEILLLYSAAASLASFQHRVVQEPF